MPNPTHEAARLADDLTQLASQGSALIHLQSCAYICQKFSEAATILRRIPELEAERDQLRAELEKVRGVATIKFGCHCDLEPNMQPDGCVLDEGTPESCVNARRISAKEQCIYWKRIESTPPHAGQKGAA